MLTIDILRRWLLAAAIGAALVFAAHGARAQAPGPYFAADQARSALAPRYGMRRVVAAPRGGEAHDVLASWYGGVGEKLARHSADGSIFRPGALTAASRSLAFGTRLRVSFRGRSTIVTITDRGPNIRTGRSLDLSRGAAAAIGMISAGVARVTIERLN